ncbi:Uncharacterised protein [Bordetella pertussis]|nr:Uncharacterised protein [Bordetella pertussis]
MAAGKEAERRRDIGEGGAEAAGARGYAIPPDCNRLPQEKRTRPRYKVQASARWMSCVTKLSSGDGLSSTPGCASVRSMSARPKRQCSRIDSVLNS